MAEAVSDGPNNKRIAAIEDRILDAVNVLLLRAWSNDPSHPEILDRKGSEKLETSGVVQDCEFGLMVLMADDWLSGRLHKAGELADEEKLKKLMTALVKSTVENVTARSGPGAAFMFGRGRLPDSPVFFSGAPYTFYKDEKKKAFVSANLDAAMLIVAFLSAALEKYDDLLSDAIYAPSEDLKRLGFATLRDAALFVCNEGLRYAIGCRVVRDDNAFDGYSCDPETNKDSSFPLEKLDRLFFTWTTCETINELLGWEAYLNRLGGRPSAPSIVNEIKSHLSSLRGDLEKASQWCYDTFFPTFSKILEAPPRIGPVVIEIGDLGPEAVLNEELQSKCKEIETFVLHVYHISQYAAIRSIRPVGLKVGEVRQLLLHLDNLVSQYILGTGLDAARHEDLYRTLTRYYKLGVTTNTMYRDDAYFPLVVRSLSGLLSRTVDSLDATRRDTQELVKSFDLSLEKNYQNLLMRQAKQEQDGDERLWSIMTGKPYVLYATQRTVFALIEYMKFIQKMEDPDEEPENNRAQKDLSLSELLTKALAEALLAPVINGVLDRYPHIDSGQAKAQNALAQDNLPEPGWARQVISSWLSEVKGDFTKNDLQHTLAQLTEQLIFAIDAWQDLEVSGRIATKDPRDKSRKLGESISKLLELPTIGKTLAEFSKNKTWDREVLCRILFEHMFHEFVGNGQQLSKVVMRNGTLSSTIISAHKYAMDLSKDPT